MQIARSTVEQFRRDGFVHLSKFIPVPLITRAYEAVPDLIARSERAFGRCRDCCGVHHDFEERDCGNLKRPFVQLFNAWAQSSAFRELVFHPALAQAARSLLGCDEVRLIHDQLLVKRPGDLPTTAHIDGNHWPFEGRACTFWVPLVDVSSAMGTLLFYRGTHARDISRAQLQTADEETAREVIARWLAREGLEPQGFEVRRGEATAHDKWTAHCTAANESSLTRAVLAVHVMDARSKRTAPAGPMQQSHIDLFHWHGVPPAAEMYASVCPLL